MQPPTVDYIFEDVKALSYCARAHHCYILRAPAPTQHTAMYDFSQYLRKEETHNVIFVTPGGEARVAFPKFLLQGVSELWNSRDGECLEASTGWQFRAGSRLHTFDMLLTLVFEPRQRRNMHCFASITRNISSKQQLRSCIQQQPGKLSKGLCGRMVLPSAQMPPVPKYAQYCRFDHPKHHWMRASTHCVLWCCTHRGALAAMQG